MKKTMAVVAALLLTVQSDYGAVKKILLEDLAGAWCQYCPRGPVLMEKFRTQYPNNVIALTQHGKDKMQNVYSKVLYDTAPGFPALMVNRKLESSMSATVLNSYAGSLSLPAPVAVGITHAWNNATRLITGTVTAKFESAVTAGDLRIGLMIVEHNVVGTGTGYDQANYYNTLSTYPELKGAGNPIVGYKHYMVNRDCLLEGIFGKKGIIPATPVVGTTYSAPFSYTVPAQYNSLNVILNNLYLVAFVGYYRYGNITTGAILNAEQVKLNTATFVSHGDPLQRMADMRCKVKAVGSDLYINTQVPGNYTIELYSLSGRKTATLGESYLAAGEHLLTIQDKNIRNGMYLVKIETNGHSTVDRVSLMR